jgi:hypothetical protein
VGRMRGRALVDHPDATTREQRSGTENCPLAWGT